MVVVVLVLVLVVEVNDISRHKTRLRQVLLTFLLAKVQKTLLISQTRRFVRKAF